MMICAKCRHELKPDAAFCAHCGTPVGDDVTVILPRSPVSGAAGETVILPAGSVTTPPMPTATSAPAEGGMQARLPGFSMALDPERPTEILQPSATQSGRPKWLWAALGLVALLVLTVVWSLISGGDEALKAGPQLAEPDVLASEPAPVALQSEPMPVVEAPAETPVSSEPVLVAEPLPPPVEAQTSSASSIAQAARPAPAPVRPRVVTPPKASDEDEAYLRQIRRQLEQQKDW